MLTARLRALIAAYGRYVAGLAVRGIEVLGKLGLYILAAMVLGLHDAGQFFLCITWVSLAATIGRMGFERAMTRHIAAELGLGRGRAALRDLLVGTGWTAFGAVAIGIATWLAAEPVAAGIFGQPDFAHALALSPLLILPQTLSVSLGYVLTGLKRGIASQVVQNAIWPSIALGALALGVDRLDHLLWALSAGLWLSTVVGLVLVFRDRHRFVDRGAAAPLDATAELPTLWRTARPLAVVEITQVSLNSLPALVLGAFATPAAVGAFSIAHRMSLMIWVVILSIGIMVAPHFAELHRREEWAALRAQNRRARHATAVLGAPVCLAMMLWPEPLLRLMGAGFETAATALVILAAGQLVNCILASQDLMLAMTGHGRLLQRLNLLQLAAAILLSAALIPPFGMIGAAIVGSWTVAQGAIGTTWAVRRTMPRAF